MLGDFIGFGLNPVVIVAGRLLADNDVAALVLLVHEEVLESSHRHQALCHLGDASHEHAGHGESEDMEIGGHYEDLIGG